MKTRVEDNYITGVKAEGDSTNDNVAVGEGTNSPECTESCSQEFVSAVSRNVEVDSIVMETRIVADGVGDTRRETLEQVMEDSSLVGVDHVHATSDDSAHVVVIVDFIQVSLPNVLLSSAVINICIIELLSGPVSGKQ